MEKYTLIYSESFKNSLQENISENQLKRFPEMYEDGTRLYGFDTPTYRILIGKSFAIFYRIDQKEQTVLIGNIFRQKLMKLLF
ncbi:hypothetical protein SAMN04487821_112110 [Enterococcus malodoratus]|uniref:type II toxin-antitoxin system RelE/ParE family toxin n=1 Tax=Enterococcus malodoratus TaxID=71451 RepID=UPI0008CA9603|nr:type II toxin-antitoxin system RelE/ParE family toxin [Enterococcus malodoratus]SET45077.1 hypothetical protein SAMN04487821_112110 [Enterococcus malodoratus]